MEEASVRNLGPGIEGLRATSPSLQTRRTGPAVGQRADSRTARHPRLGRPTVELRDSCTPGQRLQAVLSLRLTTARRAGSIT